MDEITVVKEILSDAIVVATEAEKKCRLQTRIITAMSCVIIVLVFLICVR